MKPAVSQLAENAEQNHTKKTWLKTHLQIGNWIETLHDFVCFKRAVRAVTHRHEAAMTTLQVEAVAGTVDDANVYRRLRHDAKCRHDHVFLSQTSRSSNTLTLTHSCNN